MCGPLSSPLVWRELPEYGGRRLLIGGAGEFQEYACQYYALTSRMSSCRMVTLAKQNVAFKQQVRVYDVGCIVISTSSALEVFLNDMRYINPRFTYLLTYLHQSLVGAAPAYLADDCRLLSDVGRRPLRSNSNDTRKLLVTRTHNKLGDRRLGVSRPPVLDYGTTVLPDYGCRDLPSTPSDNH